MNRVSKRIKEEEKNIELTWRREALRQWRELSGIICNEGRLWLR